MIAGKLNNDLIGPWDGNDCCRDRLDDLQIKVEVEAPSAHRLIAVASRGPAASIDSLTLLFQRTRPDTVSYYHYRAIILTEYSAKVGSP